MDWGPTNTNTHYDRNDPYGNWVRPLHYNRPQTSPPQTESLAEPPQPASSSSSSRSSNPMSTPITSKDCRSKEPVEKSQNGYYTNPSFKVYDDTWITPEEKVEEVKKDINKKSFDEIWFGKEPSTSSGPSDDTKSVTKKIEKLSLTQSTTLDSSKTSSSPRRRLQKPEDKNNWRPTSPTGESLEKLERELNEFSKHYKDTGKKPNKKSSSSTKKMIRGYKHDDGIQFAAQTYEWLNNRCTQLEPLPREPEPPVPCFEPDEGELLAFYRVIVERDDGNYTLMACHVNMHGFHRGDLRFVEVNDRTRVKGIRCSVSEGLFIGDIVAVLEMVPIGEDGFVEQISATEVTHDSPCSWMVSRMILMPRRLKDHLTFSFIENRQAIVAGHDETMKVQITSDQHVEVGLIYIGSAFIPKKLEHCFTSDFPAKNKNAILASAAKLSSFPNAFGMIYQFVASEARNKLFNVGTKAFNKDIELENRDIVVETCAIMGYSAANTIFNGRFDCRAFSMIEPQRSGNIVKFRIENPKKHPTAGVWTSNTKIVCGGPEGDFNGTVETAVTTEDSLFLKISARISRDAPKHMNFSSGNYIVSQREPIVNCVLEEGFFQCMDHKSNGRKVIETLYGGPRLLLKPESEEFMGDFVFPGSPPISLNKYQNEYIRMLLNDNPMVIGSSPFGCGKSMTIVTAAFEIHKRNCERSILKNSEQQLLITQSNYASVNLIEIAKKAHLMDADDVRFVRFVSEKNWRELPEQCQTDYDMPFLMEKLFVLWAMGQETRQSKKFTGDQMSHIISFIIDKDLLHPSNFQGAAFKAYKTNGSNNKYLPRPLIEAFFLLYQPDIIMITADTTQFLMKNQVLKNVSTVQIDEASQLPEYTLLSLLVNFSNACFGLIGDINQLPPYCHDDLSGRLKEYGIGNTMERAIKGKMFPEAILRYVYRCHPKSTQLLSELFYDGELLSGVTDNMRNEFMRHRPDFWPNFDFPVMVLNNQSSCFKMGTSYANETEVEIVKRIVAKITRSVPGYSLLAKDVGIISFYAAQTSVLAETMRGTGVKCGTVDSFQGSEREVVILCCTNEKPSEFMQLSNRLNVAMSRARQATIIIGNVNGLKKARYWKTIVEKAEDYGCVLDT